MSSHPGRPRGSDIAGRSRQPPHARQAPPPPAAGIPRSTRTEQTARHLIHQRPAGSRAAPQPTRVTRPPVHGLDDDPLRNGTEAPCTPLLREQLRPHVLPGPLRGMAAQGRPRNTSVAPAPRSTARNAVCESSFGAHLRCINMALLPVPWVPDGAGSWWMALCGLGFGRCGRGGGGCWRSGLFSGRCGVLSPAADRAAVTVRGQGPAALAGRPLRARPGPRPVPAGNWQ